MLCSSVFPCAIFQFSHQPPNDSRSDPGHNRDKDFLPRPAALVPGCQASQPPATYSLISWSTHKLIVALSLPRSGSHITNSKQFPDSLDPGHTPRCTCPLCPAGQHNNYVQAGFLNCTSHQSHRFNTLILCVPNPYPTNK